MRNKTVAQTDLKNQQQNTPTNQLKTYFDAGSTTNPIAFGANHQAVIEAPQPIFFSVVVDADHTRHDTV
jgi:hypothetical protein